MLPFTHAEFFAVFARYNQTIWPLQLLFVAAAVIGVFMVRRGGAARSRAMLGLLAALWLWTGVVYHGMFFRPVNPAAALFAVMFIAESAALAFAAARPAVEISLRADLPTALGMGLVVFALVLYPLLGQAAGHTYPSNPTFGAPCPTTIYTIGVLLWTRPLRARLLVIPLLWAGIGMTAALKLGVYEDSGLLLAAIAAIIALVQARRRETALAHAM